MIVSMAFNPFPGRGLILAVLSAASIIWCGRRFFSRGFTALIHGAATMDTLIALSVSISWLFSLFNLCFPGVWTSRGMQAHLYFESSTMIIAFILLGRLLEEKAKRSTASAIRGLMGLQPRTVTVQKVEVNCGAPQIREEIIPIDEVRAGDIVIVKPGERISVDGVVATGVSYVDESMLTGESVPAPKAAGDKVYTGTVNQKGYLTVRCKSSGKDTLLSSIIRMVRDAQGSKAPIQNTVDKIAAVFVPAIIGISLLTLLCWIIFDPADGVTHGLVSMVSVLVIACPCSLGLATPTAIIAGIGRGAREGILIKDAASLQLARKITTVVLDKTGTLTEGHPSVVESVWDPDDMQDEDTRLRDILYSLELKSEHPLADAVIRSLRGCELVVVNDFKMEPGMGISGIVEGRRYYIGHREMVPEKVLENSSALLVGSLSEWSGNGSTISVMFDDEKMHAVFAIDDALKDSSLSAVRELQEKGTEVHLLTGDNPGAAARVAAIAGIDNVHSGVRPDGKAAIVKSLRGEGKVVAMAGDGINDCAALAVADIGIAMGGGSDIAIDTAMATIVSSDLSKIASLMKLSRRTSAIIRGNLFWAFFYNILAVPVAAGVLYPAFGFTLSPMIAAACMAASSLCVVTNSLRLKRVRL